MSVCPIQPVVITSYMDQVQSCICTNSYDYRILLVLWTQKPSHIHDKFSTWFWTLAIVLVLSTLKAHHFPRFIGCYVSSFFTDKFIFWFSLCDYAYFLSQVGNHNPNNCGTCKMFSIWINQNQCSALFNQINIYISGR